MKRKAIRLIGYRNSANIGDAIQYIALAKIIRSIDPGLEIRTIDRESLQQFVPSPDERFVVNGWHRNTGETGKSPAIFWGVHAHPNKLDWMQMSEGLIGARDPYTRDWLHRAGLQAELVGCATIAGFDRYEGPRSGEYAVDAEGPGVFVHHSFKGLRSWAWQLDHALDLLEKYRKAECVTTSRLHCALPCLAFGTPVRFFRSRNETERYGIADRVGLENGKLIEHVDISYWRDRYTGRLRTLLVTNQSHRQNEHERADSPD